MLIEDIISSNINRDSFVYDSINLAHKYQNDYNSFVTIIDKPMKSKDGILKDIPYALKDNISTKGILTTASSNILKDYVPVYDATVYKKLTANGAVLIGKTVLDELAMGGTGTTAHTGGVCNPWDKKRQIGGSSSGSASAVALGIVPFALGSDTGDSIRKPAAYGGVVGFKPTYGRVSRYGLFPFASSLDHIGVLTRSVKDVAYVMDIIKGYDENDMTSIKDSDGCYTQNINDDITNKKLFYIKELLDYDNPSNELKEILDNFNDILNKCKKNGFTVEEVSINKSLLEAIYPSYITISCAEATSNNANLTGLIFGSREKGKNYEEIMTNTRTKGFSELIKRRFVLGSFILQKENQDKLFLNACRIRRMIVDVFNELFDKYDGLILPATGNIAPKFAEKTDKLSDEYLLLGNHLIIGNFGGYPSITIPSGFVKDMPIGINITCGQFKDSLTLNMAYKLEEHLGYKGQIAKGDK